MWRLPPCNEVLRGYCTPLTSDPLGYYLFVLSNYRGYICMAVAIYPVLLPYCSRYCCQMGGSCSSQESRSSSPYWNLWVMISFNTLLWCSHGKFDCYFSGFRVWPVAGMGIDYLDTIFIRYSCGLYHIFTGTLFLIVNWTVHELGSEIPECPAFNRIGQYTGQPPLWKTVFYLQATLCHYVCYKEVPSIYVFGPLGAR